MSVATTQVIILRSSPRCQRLKLTVCANCIIHTYILARSYCGHACDRFQEEPVGSCLGKLCKDNLKILLVGGRREETVLLWDSLGRSPNSDTFLTEMFDSKLPRRTCEERRPQSREVTQCVQ
ncbi:hypothetical protein M405DRAFT_171944 [Rhizopogon salebrosus TDB-379]|nr:hypothetical protein M405DRAFT_171944 [Rhizopogon salebrosus TDB-379]